MLKITLALIFAVLAIGFADARVQLHRGLTNINDQAGHPYLFLTVPRGRGSALVQGFEILEDEVDDKNVNAANGNADNADDNENNDDDDDENSNDDDDDDDNKAGEPIVGFVHNAGLSRAAISDDDMLDDDEEEENNDEEIDDSKDVGNMVQVVGDKRPMMTTSSGSNATPMSNSLQMILQNAKPTQMMVSKEHAGAIMVPDGIIEIEGQRIVDEKTGKAHLLVPREALDAIPDGSVVALMERAAGEVNDANDADDDEEAAERANRVIVRRRRRGSRRNVRRRGGNKRGNQRRRVVYYNNNANRNNRRRRVNNNNRRRTNVRVIRTGNNNNRNRNRNRNRRRRTNNNRRRYDY